MVRPPKNIQWWWSPQKPLKICNGLFTFLDPRYVDLYALEEDVLQRIVEDISRCCLIFQSSLKYLDMILSSFGDMILTRDSIINLKTIVDHCPQNFENHRKTIGSNGWTPKKTFNGDGPTLTKPLKNHWRQWWPIKKTLTIPSPWKIDHRCGLNLIHGFPASVEGAQRVRPSHGHRPARSERAPVPASCRTGGLSSWQLMMAENWFLLKTRNCFCSLWEGVSGWRRKVNNDSPG